MDAAYEIPMEEFSIRRVHDGAYALTSRCWELVADPFGASWNGPPWDETADLHGYSRDEDEIA